MVDKVFPSNGDTADEVALRRAFKKTVGVDDRVVTGFTVTNPSGLTARFASGSAYVNGTYVDRDVTTDLALADNATNHLFVGYDDSNQNTVLFTKTTDGSSPGENYIKVAEVVTLAGAVTDITDKRKFGGFTWNDVQMERTGADELSLYDLMILSRGLQSHALAIIGTNGNGATYTYAASTSSDGDGAYQSGQLITIVEQRVRVELRYDSANSYRLNKTITRVYADDARTSLLKTETLTYTYDGSGNVTGYSRTVA